jgi:PAS domain S-box-containing protein
MAEEHAGDSHRASGGDLLSVFWPLIALGAFTAVLAALAGLLGWYSQEMLVTAAVSGGMALAVAGFLSYRQLSARRELQAVQARVSGIVESAMDAIITVDDTQKVVLYNAAAEKVFRWPSQAVIGQSLDMLIPERFRARHAEHIRRFGETGVTSRSMGDQLVLSGLRANGEEFPIEASISQHVENGRRFYTVILRDVTERQRAERLHARDEARLRSILDSAMDAIITVDDTQHVVLFNKAAEQVFGCPRAEAIGAPLSWFMPERFRAGHADHVRRFGETGSSSRRMGAQRIVMGLRRNGEEFPIDASISAVEEQGRKFYTVILRDVTERVRAEQELLQSRQELRELAAAANSVREQEKSRIARELHDELAQALTALKMDVAWTRERLAPGQDALAAKLAAMQELLDSTVAATRRISADLRPLMLDDLGLAPAAEWLVQNFRQRTGIQCELAIGAGELELDDERATAVFRILQESLTNVARHAQASQVEVNLDKTDHEVLLSVHDNGQGFSTATPRKRGSFGLMGLRERAQLLGGSVEIDSAPGEGTTIEVRIPLPETAAA